MKKTILFAIAMLLATNLYAGDGTFKQIMQQLGSDYSDLNRAILWEDFAAAAEAAHAIAYHDKPSKQQRMKVMGILGAEMPNFKKADSKVHELAMEIEEAARAKDMELLIQRQSQMLSACMTCHTAYRNSVVSGLNR